MHSPLAVARAKLEFPCNRGNSIVIDLQAARMIKAVVQKRAIAGFLVFSMLASVSVQSAQAASANTANVDADIVKLTNGGFIRGVIFESVPGGLVKLRTTEGTIREFSASEYTYAGPFEAPAPPPPNTTAPPSSKGRKIKLTLMSSEQGSSFQIQNSISTSGSLAVGHYETLCTAPCSVELPPGALRLRLTTLDDRSVDLDPVMIEKDSTLGARYISRSSTRTAGWIAGTVGILAGFGLMLYEEDEPGGCCDVNHPYVGTGLLVLLATCVAVPIMLARQDRVETIVTP
jgi:hypothetical protein